MSYSKPIGDKVEVEEEPVELYRCITCNKYLSSAPLKILDNGKIICTHCPAEKFVTSDTVETFFRKLHFPCKFKQYGCNARLAFGHVEEHEALCKFEPVSCFILPANTCTWKGQMKDVTKHFLDTHPQNVVQNGGFVIGYESETEEKVVISEQESAVTILYYSFNTAKKEFKYCLRYISDYNIAYEIKIANPENEKLCFWFNYDKHQLYQNKYTFTGESLLNLDGIVPLLEKVNKFSFTTKVIPSINLDEMDSLRCNFCEIFITLPIFKTEDNKFACSTCGDKRSLKIFEDDNLQQRMTRFYYQCRWKLCKFVDIHNKIRLHERNCDYRDVICPVQNCYQTFRLEDVSVHFSDRHKDVSHISKWTGTTHNIDTRLSITYYAVVGETVFLVTYTANGFITRYFVTPQSASRLVTVLLNTSCCLHSITSSKLACAVATNVADYIVCDKLYHVDPHYSLSYGLTSSKK